MSSSIIVMKSSCSSPPLPHEESDDQMVNESFPSPQFSEESKLAGKVSRKQKNGGNFSMGGKFPLPHQTGSILPSDENTGGTNENYFSLVKKLHNEIASTPIECDVMILPEFPVPYTNEYEENLYPHSNPEPDYEGQDSIMFTKNSIEQYFQSRQELNPCGSENVIVIPPFSESENPYTAGQYLLSLTNCKVHMNYEDERFLKLLESLSSRDAAQYYYELSLSVQPIPSTFAFNIAGPSSTFNKGGSGTDQINSLQVNFDFERAFSEIRDFEKKNLKKAVDKKNPNDNNKDIVTSEGMKTSEEKSNSSEESNQQIQLKISWPIQWEVWPFKDSQSHKRYTQSDSTIAWFHSIGSAFNPFKEDLYHWHEHHSNLHSNTGINSKQSTTELDPALLLLKSAMEKETQSLDNILDKICILTAILVIMYGCAFRRIIGGKRTTENRFQYNDILHCNEKQMNKSNDISEENTNRPFLLTFHARKILELLKKTTLCLLSIFQRIGHRFVIDNNYISAEKISVADSHSLEQTIFSFKLRSSFGSFQLLFNYFANILRRLGLQISNASTKSKHKTASIISSVKHFVFVQVNTIKIFATSKLRFSFEYFVCTIKRVIKMVTIIIKPFANLLSISSKRNTSTNEYLASSRFSLGELHFWKKDNISYVTPFLETSPCSSRFSNQQLRYSFEREFPRVPLFLRDDCLKENTLSNECHEVFEEHSEQSVLFYKNTSEFGQISWEENETNTDITEISLTLSPSRSDQSFISFAVSPLHETISTFSLDSTRVSSSNSSCAGPSLIPTKEGSLVVQDTNQAFDDMIKEVRSTPHCNESQDGNTAETSCASLVESGKGSRTDNHINLSTLFAKDYNLNDTEETVSESCSEHSKKSDCETKSESDELGDFSSEKNKRTEDNNTILEDISDDHCFESEILITNDNIDVQGETENYRESLRSVQNNSNDLVISEKMTQKIEFNSNPSPAPQGENVSVNSVHKTCIGSKIEEGTDGITIEEIIDIDSLSEKSSLALSIEQDSKKLSKKEEASEKEQCVYSPTRDVPPSSNGLTLSPCSKLERVWKQRKAFQRRRSPPKNGHSKQRQLLEPSGPPSTDSIIPINQLIARWSQNDVSADENFSGSSKNNSNFKDSDSNEKNRSVDETKLCGVEDHLMIRLKTKSLALPTPSLKEKVSKSHSLVPLDKTRNEQESERNQDKSNCELNDSKLSFLNDML